MLKNLSPRNGSHLRRVLSKLAVTVALLLMLAITASAYTLVFRDGRRIEVPSQFTLTKTTLTYEVSPGFNKSIQLILIDVAATERANKEAPGSFFKHKEEAPVTNDPGPQAVRTLTNRDLAAVRQRRIESERAYETRRRELGLPTVEETRRRQAEEGAALRAEIREASAARAREEVYWRGRARELRTEIAIVETQINFVRGRLNEVNESSLANRTWVEVYPIGPGSGPWGGNWPWQQYPNYPYPGYPQARPIPGLGYPYPYGYPTGPFDDYNSEESRTRQALTNRLDDLLVRRAGLLAQWRALEDEARDARVPQIWLEP